LSHRHRHHHEPPRAAPRQKFEPLPAVLFEGGPLGEGERRAVRVLEANMLEVALERPAISHLLSARIRGSPIQDSMDLLSAQVWRRDFPNTTGVAFRAALRCFFRRFFQLAGVWFILGISFDLDICFVTSFIHLMHPFYNYIGDIAFILF